MIFKVNPFKKILKIPSKMMKMLLNGSLSMLLILTDLIKLPSLFISKTEKKNSPFLLDISMLIIIAYSSVKILLTIHSLVL
jgi:hypothetical protein